MGTEARTVGDAARARAEALDAEIELKAYDDEDAARTAVADESVDAALSGRQLVTGTSPSETLLGLLQAANSDVRGSEALRAEGVPEDRIRAALDPPPLTVTEIEDGSSGQGLALLASLYLYLVLLSLGLMLVTGVTEEKATRVVEVILAAIRPTQLLAGKIVGIGLLGLLQVLTVTAVGLGAAVAAGSLDLPESTPEMAILVLVYFLLGYVLYACAFAVAGVMVSRQEDANLSATPLSLILVAGYVASFSVPPDSPVATVLTLLPPTAPMIAPARAAQDALPGWELALSIVLMIAAAAALLWLAGRIYDRAALRMGAPLSLRATLRLAR